MGTAEDLLRAATGEAGQGQLQTWRWGISGLVDQNSAQINPFTGVPSNIVVDPVNGNDANTGAPGSPIQTLSRLYTMTLGKVITVPTTVTIASQPPTTDHLNLNVQIATNGSLTVQGTYSIVTPAGGGTITAQTTINRGTQTPQDITDTGLPAAGSWAGLDNTTAAATLLAVTGGNAAHVGGFAWPCKNLGAKKVRTNTFFKPDPPGGGTQNGTNFTPSVNDTYELRRLISVNVGTVTISAFDNADVVQFPFLLFKYLSLQGFGIGGNFFNLTNAGYFGSIHACQVNECNFIGPWNIFACRFEFSNQVLANGSVTGYAALATSITSGGGTIASIFVEGGGFLLLDYDALAQGCAFIDMNGPATFLGVGTYAGFDCPGGTDVIFISPGGLVEQTPVNSGVDLLWGTANAFCAIQVQSAGQYAYVTKPTISGNGVNDFIIGGVNHLAAALPLVVTGTTGFGAAIAVLA